MSQEALQEALLKANAKLKAAQSKIKKQDAIIQQLHRTIECSRGGWHGDGQDASNEDKEDKDEESLCCICLVNKADSAPTPCGHVCACQSCLEIVMRSDNKNCPICRTHIKGIQSVHWSVTPSLFRTISQVVAEPFKSYGISRRDARRTLDEVGNDIAAAGEKLVHLANQRAEVNMEGLVAKIVAASGKNDCKDVVDTMREGIYSEVVVGKGLEAVASLCENRDDCAEAHRVMFSQTLDGVPLLLEVMREHQRSEEIARVGFLAVWYLTRNDDITRMIGESGGIPLLVEMLEEHGERNAEVAKNGLAALLNLASNDDNEKRIGEAGGIAMILRMLDVHGESNAVVAEEGCSALRSLANNADNKKSIGEAGGIVMILRMLDVHGESNAGVAEDGCGALWHLAYQNADNKRKILAANGVSMVERMKSTWASNECVQTYCTRTVLSAN